MNIGSVARRGLLVGKKFSPEVLTAVGIAGGITAAVLGARATLKLEEKIDAINLNREGAKMQSILRSGEFSKDALYQTQIRKVYVKGTFEIAKLYAPAVGVGLVSIACIVGAHGIMRQRNVALVGALASATQAFANYRESVKDQLGEDAERDIRLGLHEIDVVDADGKVTKKKAIGAPDKDHQYSQYMRVFDHGNPNWHTQHELNLMFLRTQEQFANDMLRARGHVLLNDVYDMLGFERTGSGAIVGWAITKGEGDNFVDFGIYDLSQDRKRAFINGDEPFVVLDFNVDGVVYDLI